MIQIRNVPDSLHRKLKVRAAGAGLSLSDYLRAEIERWELRDNLTAYDAMYVVLAEALNGVLVTSDSRLGAAPGHEARIEIVR